MGVPSLQILLHEIIKLMYYAKVKNPVFFRIGTSGGIGVEPGSVIISNGAVDEMINPYHEQVFIILCFLFLFCFYRLIFHNDNNFIKRCRFEILGKLSRDV